MANEVREITDHSEIQYEPWRWLADLSDHPVIIDDQGTYRFRQTKDWEKYNLNQMAIDYQNGRIPREEYMQFHRDIGYSLSGYWDIMGDELDMIARQQIMELPIEEIEEEIYDNGDVVTQFTEMAKDLAEYDPENDTFPDLEEAIKLLRLAAHLYKETNK
jgi:hypothetical protein